jgi:uncharacterized membrane protein
MKYVASGIVAILAVAAYFVAAVIFSIVMGN